MANVNTLLNERLKKADQSSKMSVMARQSASGNLTSFSGVFSISELNDHEKMHLEALLREYASDHAKDISSDLRILSSITAEVKAISNQAAILHGERIKRARSVLAHYRDGAFSAWLISTYGNRQTPYNFLQYFEFCEAMPKSLRPQLDQMPRQAIYSLASRDAPLPQKQKIVASYNGETKAELLRLIRETFPLSDKDKRREDRAVMAVTSLKRLYETLRGSTLKFSKSQKQEISQILTKLHKLFESC